MNNIEIVAIGNEILKGNINNTNATEISQALFLAGYPTSRHSVLPDDAVELKAALGESLKRSRIVISTGGLGPTCDDITRQIAAELFDSDFHLDEKLLQTLKQRYGNLPASLENQATVPTKAIILNNEYGTAPGLVFHNSENTLILMPGVPREMRALLHQKVIPFIQKHYPNTRYVTRTLHFFGLSESSVDPHLRDLQKKLPDIDIGIYPTHGTVKVQFTLDATKNSAAQSQLDEACQSLAKAFASNHFEAASGKLEEAVHQRFIEKNWTLSLAESCTGGGIAARLTKLPGASKYFLGGIVSYSNALKEQLLNVPQSTLSTYGAVSQEAALEMVKGILDKTQSEFGIAITGIAGPDGGTPDKPVGTVWIAVARRGATPVVSKLIALGNRDMIIEFSINGALARLLQYTQNL